MRTEVKEQRKENFIQKIIRTHKVKEEQKLRKQLNFLFQQVFQWYYDSLQHGNISEVDLPEFIYERECSDLAARKTFNELLYRVADKKVVNKLAQKRISQLKRQGIKISL